MSRTSGIMISKEDRQKMGQQWRDDHFLEDGKRYTFNTRKKNKKYGWEVRIRQADSPYFIVCVQDGFSSDRKATKWAKEYLKRGGPPEGYFNVTPDPNVITYRKEQ